MTKTISNDTSADGLILLRKSVQIFYEPFNPSGILPEFGVGLLHQEGKIVGRCQQFRPVRQRHLQAMGASHCLQ